MESAHDPMQSFKHAIQKVAKCEGFNDYDVEIGTGLSKGDNFMGDVYRVTVKEKDTNKALNLIVKVAPAHIARDDIPVHVWYNREIVAYNEVFNDLKELQDESDVGSVARFDFVECFYASDELNKELLVLQNLTIEGFELLGRQNRVELKHALLALSSVARLHALSFVLQTRSPEHYDRLANKVPDFITGQKAYDTFLGLSLDLAEKSVESLILKEKLSQFKKTYWEIMQNTLKHDKYNVISHGDCWINNMMFKNENGKPVEVRLIDFQIVRHGPPSVDIMYFLLTSTDRQFRKDHYRDCLDHYYESLLDALKQFHLNIDNVFPRQQFDEQVKRCSLYGFFAGVGFCKPFVVEGEDTMDVTEMIDPDEMVAPKGVFFERYLKRLTELIEDCMEYGYL